MRHVMDKTLIFLAMIALITIGMIQVSPTTKLTEDPGKHSEPQDVFNPQADNLEYVETPKIVSEINDTPEPSSLNPSILHVYPPMPNYQAGQIISKTGAWQNVMFHHIVDTSFGSALARMLKQNNITSVTDLGCGTGSYVEMISELGIKAQGFDGNPDTKTLDSSGGLCVGPVDLTKERFWNATDAVISIEVGEHIPAELEAAFLDNVADSARRMVILTWAPPDQGGEGHVNGHTAEDIELKMKGRGWEKNENLTHDLKRSAEIWWIRNNLQVFLPDT